MIWSVHGINEGGPTYRLILLLCGWKEDSQGPTSFLPESSPRIKDGLDSRGLGCFGPVYKEEAFCFASTWQGTVTPAAATEVGL